MICGRRMEGRVTITWIVDSAKIRAPVPPPSSSSSSFSPILPLPIVQWKYSTSFACITHAITAFLRKTPFVAWGPATKVPISPSHQATKPPSTHQRLGWEPSPSKQLYSNFTTVSNHAWRISSWLESSTLFWAPNLPCHPLQVKKRARSMKRPTFR